MKKLSKRLALSTQTIRSLQSDELAQVAGGTIGTSGTSIISATVTPSGTSIISATVTPSATSVIRTR